MREQIVVGLWVAAAMACGDRAPSSPPDATGTDAGVTSDAAPDAYVIPAPPVTENGTLRLEIAASVQGTLVATDPNGQQLTYSIVSQPTSGTISSFDPATGAFTYTSTSLVPGSDSFTFQANDGALDAPTPGVITITVDPVLFTGSYAVSGVTDNGAACSPFSVRVGQAPAYFDVGQHNVSSCGNTSYNFTPYRSSSSATASLLAFSRSQFVSGCGTVTHQLRIERTLAGFTYQNTIHTPCFGIGTHVITGTATRAPIAYLFAEGTLAHGSKLQGSTSTQTLTLRNVGRPAATAIAFTGPMAPFGFTGGSFPGTGGTCSDTLAGLATCTISIDMSTATLGSFSGSWSATYDDTTTTYALSGTTTGAVVPNLTNVTAAAAGFDFTCAIDNGAVVCWGDVSAVMTIPTLTNPTAITAGGSHACAIDSTGVVCWGSNSAGQTTVPSLTNPTLVSAGNAHTCALDATDVKCWGANTSGQSTVPALTDPAFVTAGGSHTCALDASGVVCWGLNTSGQTTVPATLTGATRVSAGYQHTCAIGTGGAVSCWGSNTFNRATPPVGLPPATEIAAGGIHTCAVASNVLRCWGFSLPATPNGGGPIDSLVTGYDHGCIRYNGGTAFRCWGSQAWP